MAMPTLQQIIGTITGKVAFERTQANFTTIKDAHDDLDDVVIAHKAEIVSKSVRVTRDLSLTGTQIVSGLPFTPKAITANASVFNIAGKQSLGFATQDGYNCSMGKTTDGKSLHSATASIFMFELSTTNATLGTVTFQNKQLTITWAHNGVGVTGSVVVDFLILGHGGV